VDTDVSRLYISISILLLRNYLLTKYISRLLFVVGKLYAVTSFCCNAFSALTLLVGCQEEHLACKKIE